MSLTVIARIQWWMVIVALVLSVAPGARGTTNDSSATITRRWVQELGAAEFRVRERAAEQLRGLGMTALPALEEVENSPDPELRLRVQELLGDLRLGVAPDWPTEWLAAARGLAQRPPAERVEVIRQIAAALQGRAVSFLMVRLTSGGPEEQELAERLIREVRPKDQAAHEVLRWPKPPVTAIQRHVRGWALGELGQPVEALRALGEQPAKDGLRRDLVEKVIGELQARLRQDPLAVVKTTQQLIEVVPDEGRFLHLLGLALTEGGQPAAAQGLVEQALALNPQDKAAHFSTATMLIELKQPGVAADELELVLKIPGPADVYDLNAHFDLAPLQAQEHRYAEAADSYAKGLALYREMRAAGSGVGLVGAKEEQVEQQIADLRRRAAKIAQQDLTLRFEPVLKDCDAAKWRAALTGVEATVTVRVEPHGFRLFDVEGASLRYDRQKKQLVPLLHDQPAGTPLPLGLNGKAARIVVNSLDCYYVYELDGETGVARRIARLERDYRVQVIPGPRVRELREVVVTINGETNDWQRLQAGAVFDYLPEKMTIEVHGRATNETWETIRQVVPVQEPPLKLLDQ